MYIGLHILSVTADVRDACAFLVGPTKSLQVVKLQCYVNEDVLISPYSINLSL